jgi:hypothetical protein
MIRAFLIALFMWGPFLVRTSWAGELSGAVTQASPDTTTLSVGDLGFSQAEIQSDPQFQKDLQTRSDMLQIHQTLGLITAVPLTTEYVLGLVTAGNVANGSTDTGLHATLGITTAALYATTALFAILAPKPKGVKANGNTQTHEDLAWIHAPLMVIVPLLGDMANDQVQNHQPLGGLDTVHGVFATALVVSYLSSVTVMTF